MVSVNKIVDTVESTHKPNIEMIHVAFSGSATGLGPEGPPPPRGGPRWLEPEALGLLCAMRDWERAGDPKTHKVVELRDLNAQEVLASAGNRFLSDSHGLGSRASATGEC